MALLYNLARMSTATTGTGTITLGSAVTGFLSFASAGVSDGDIISYAIQDGSNSEIGYGTYTASGTTLTRTVRKSTNSDTAISLSGSAEVFITPSATELSSTPYSALYAQNAGLAASVASSAMTIALKGADGNDPSTNNIVKVPSTTQGTGSAVTTWRQVTSSLSVVIPSSTTIGTASGVQSPCYVYAIDNSGTIELAVSLYWHGQSGVVTTVAISGGSTSTTMYSTSARTSVPFVCLGVVYSTQTTAGTWASTPSSVQMAPLKLKNYAFSAYRDTTTATWGSGADTRCPFDGEEYDDDGVYDNATNYRFMCQEPGIYDFSSSCGTFGSLTGVISVTLYKNGSTYKRGAFGYCTGAAGVGHVAAAVKLVPGDYVDVYGFQNGGANNFTYAHQNTYFMGRIARR